MTGLEPEPGQVAWHDMRMLPMCEIHERVLVWHRLQGILIMEAGSLAWHARHGANVVAWARLPDLRWDGWVPSGARLPRSADEDGHKCLMAYDMLEGPRLANRHQVIEDAGRLAWWAKTPEGPEWMRRKE